MPLGKINKRLSSLLALSVNIFLKFKCPFPFKSYEFYLLNYLKNKAFVSFLQNRLNPTQSLILQKPPDKSTPRFLKFTKIPEFYYSTIPE